MRHCSLSVHTTDTTTIVNVYFAQPVKPTNKAIIIFSDVFGISQNVQLIADDFAKRGFLTVVPDVIHGDTMNYEDLISGKADLGEWLTRHGPETVEPIAEIVIKAIRKDFHVEKLAGIGYCFGAKVCVLIYCFLKEL